MTQNQLAYQANLEKERANRAQEEIGRQNAAAQASQARSKQIETLAKRADYESQIARRQIQNGVDIANAATGGIASIGKALGGAASLAGLFI